LAEQTLADQQPGSQPLDRAFAAISGAGGNVGREISNYLSSKAYNVAIITDQLAQIEREAKGYADLRVFLGMVEPDDGRWEYLLPEATGRLRSAVATAVVSGTPRIYRAEAESRYADLSELRVLTQELFREVCLLRTSDAVSEATSTRLQVLKQLVQHLGEQLSGWEYIEILNRMLEAIGTMMAGVPRDSGQETDSLSSLAAGWSSRLNAVRALDIEAWLADRAHTVALAEQERGLAATLASHGLAAHCKVLPPSVEDPLVGAVLVAVRPADLRELPEIRSSVRDITFAILPNEVSHLSLLLSHTEGMLMPVSFQTWRHSALIRNPYGTLLGLGLWVPMPDVQTAAHSLQLPVDLREHSVARQISIMRDLLALIRLNVGRLGAVRATAAESGWHSSDVAISEQEAQVAEYLRYVPTALEKLISIATQHPDWTPVTGGVADGVLDYIEWLTGTMGAMGVSSEPDEVRLKLDDAWIACDNMLYLGRS
jgi:hypothetical protein